MPSNNPLPPKEKALFNRIVKCYEHKQYRNGFKFAKQILSNPKYAEHGETLAMKGLTMNCLGKKDEAYELVKRGLTNDISSHVCWHVYGLLQRSDKKYDEAIKCYRNALKWDPENLHILRDLSMLQIHMRDMEGHRQTKYTLLQLKPAQRAPWIGYAISNHLLKDYDAAFRVLEEFRKTQQSEDAQYEYSELLLYQNLILRQANRYQQALDHLRDNEDRILDKCALDEIKGELCLQLNDLKSAEEVYVGLIERNPENVKYYEKLEAIFMPNTTEERLEIYDLVHERFPRADAPRFLPLRFITGELFETRLNAYMRRQLTRGIPPLLITLKELYGDAAKVECISKMAENFVENLRSSNKFEPSDESEEEATTFLWALSFYGQHLDAIGRHDHALAVIDEAIAHTPTLIELHLARAKTLKHLGDMEEAAKAIDEAQSLDTADRFVNCKCVRYMIRNGQLKEAAQIASKFTRENVTVDDYALEMQCMWYELEIALSHWRSGRLGETLKKCHEVDRHFHEITQDQLEFHQYCIRKTTLNAYTRLLALEDELRAHDFYFQAARIAIEVYIQLHDEPYQDGDNDQNNQDTSLTSAELKKLRNKQRKADRKKAAAEKKRQEQDRLNKRKQQPPKNQKAEDVNDLKKEDEFQAEKLVSCSDPIEQAQRFLLPLELHRYESFETHHFAYRVAERRGKFLLMLRALQRCRKFVDEATLPDLHLCKVRFAHKVRHTTELSPLISDIIKRHKVEVFGEFEDGEDIAVSLNNEFIKQYPNSLAHQYAASKAMYYMDESRQKDAFSLLLDFSSESEHIDLKLCQRIHDSLRAKRDYGVVQSAVMKEFVSKCSAIFPVANVFGFHRAAITPDHESVNEDGEDGNCGGGGGDLYQSNIKQTDQQLPNGASHQQEQATN